MDYFKHYATASDGKSLNMVFDKFGHKGIAFWWQFLELCSEHWDGQSAPEFQFHSRTVVTKLKSSLRSVQPWLRLCSDLGMIEVEFSKTLISVKVDKLLEIKTSRNVIKSNKKQLPVYIEKNRIEKNRIEKECCVFDFEILYKKYPSRNGSQNKKKGLETVKRKIKSQKQYESFSRAIENYASEIEILKPEKKYVKAFSTFCDNWENYLEENGWDKPQPRMTSTRSGRVLDSDFDANYEKGMAFIQRLREGKEE